MEIWSGGHYFLEYECLLMVSYYSFQKKERISVSVLENPYLVEEREDQ